MSRRTMARRKRMETKRSEWPFVAKTIPRRMDGSWTDVGGGQEVVVQVVADKSKESST